MKSVLKPLAKSALILLKLTAASAAGAAIQKKIFKSGMTLFIIKEMDDVMKIVKYLVKSDLLIKHVSKKINNKAKEQKDGFFGMLLGKLSVGWFGSMLADKGLIRGSDEIIQAGEKLLRTGEEINRTG